MSNIFRRSSCRSKKGNKDSPWITKGIKTSSNVKNKLYKKWLRNRTAENELKYKNFKRYFQKIVKAREKEYYLEYFNNRSNNIKDIWNKINSIVSLKNKKKVCNINNLIVNNRIISEKNDISNEQNNYFCNVCDEINSKLPRCKTNYTEYLPKTLCNSIFFEPITNNEVFALLIDINTKKSGGPDNITPRILYDIAGEITKPLCNIFNRSSIEGVVPSKLKCAKIVPIHKKGPTNLACNYRPISLLKSFSKIVEKIMYSRLYSFLQKNKILSRHQFGFR